jgi:SAM-dependent MidA family methyltransferase
VFRGSKLFRSRREIAVTELEQIIRSEIDASGAITFARFMELALYHPAHGYYERNLKQTGRDGDFFTSVSVGSLYGEILGYDFARRLRQLPGNDIQLIEAGAHDGQLAADVLDYLRAHQREIFRRIQYAIIEPSFARAEKQFKTLAHYNGKVRWVKSWDEIPEFRGICFSNELLDAMPVHVLRWNTGAQTWTEWGITNHQGNFQWKPLPEEQHSHRARKLLARLSTDLLAVLPNDFTVELSPDAVSWWLQAAHRLNRGWLFTADYGFLQDDFFSPHRSRGTLRAYSKHHARTDLLEAVGQQDITAHVNFSLLMKAGESAGLKQEEFVQQGIYVKTVLEGIERSPAQFPLWTPMRYRQLMSLMHPEHLGRVFKVLVQSRL